MAPATKAPAATFTGAAAFVAWSKDVAVAAVVWLLVRIALKVSLSWKLDLNCIFMRSKEDYEHNMLLEMLWNGMNVLKINGNNLEVGT